MHPPLDCSGAIRNWWCCEHCQKPGLRRVIDLFAPLDPTCVAFSKIDDGRRLGDLVSALAPTRIPLAFVTNGHRVPDDLEDASPRGLAAAILRSARGVGRPRERYR